MIISKSNYSTTIVIFAAMYINHLQVQLERNLKYQYMTAVRSGKSLEKLIKFNI